MKVTQVIGLLISILSFTYYMSFAHRLDSPEEQGSITLGFGLIFVFFLAITSAILLIPTSVMLWKKKTRKQHNFNGLIWKTVLAINSTLALIYTSIGLRIAGLLVVVWASR